MTEDELKPGHAYWDGAIPYIYLGKDVSGSFHRVLGDSGSIYSSGMKFMKPGPWPDWAPDWIVEPPREIQVGDWVRSSPTATPYLVVATRGDQCLALRVLEDGRMAYSGWAQSLTHCAPHPDPEIRQKILKAAGRE